MAHTPGEIIARYLALRDKAQAVEAELEAERAKRLHPYKDAMEFLEGVMLGIQNESGVTNISVKGVGTAYQSKTTRATLVSRPSLIGAFEKGEVDLDIFTNAISKDYVTKFVEENSRAPPGVEVTQLINVRFRKA